MLQNVTHGGRRYVREFLSRRNYYCFYFGCQPPVGIGYGAFVLEIKHIPDSPDYVIYMKLPAYINGEPVIFDYFHAIDSGHSLPYYVHLLFHRIEAALVLIYSDGNHNAVEYGQGSGQNVQMTCGKRVEGPGKQCYSCQFTGVLLRFVKYSLALEK